MYHILVVGYLPIRIRRYAPCLCHSYRDQVTPRSLRSFGRFSVHNLFGEYLDSSNTYFST